MSSSSVAAVSLPVATSLSSGFVTAATKERAGRGAVADLVRTLLVALVVLLARLIGDQVPASD